MSQRPQETRSAFFYGTLMAPSVLERVTSRNKTNTAAAATAKPKLDIRPALLPGFRRHRVMGCDYPAITPVPNTTSDKASKPTGITDDGQDDGAVLGTFVTGLTDDDIRRLDAFEGSEYERRFVKVRLIAEHETTPDGRHDTRGEWATAETYVWCGPDDELEDKEWDFEEFRREKLWRWAGGSSETDTGFRDADMVVADADGDKENGVAMGGDIDPTRGRSFTGGEFEKKV